MLAFVHTPEEKGMRMYFELLIPASNKTRQQQTSCLQRLSRPEPQVRWRSADTFTAQRRPAAQNNQKGRRPSSPNPSLMSLFFVQTPEEKGDVDPYVELALFDPSSKETRQQVTSNLQNEPNPKWGEKFDFAMISAPSILTGAALSIPPCCCRQAHSCCDTSARSGLLLLVTTVCYNKVLPHADRECLQSDKGAQKESLIPVLGDKAYSAACVLLGSLEHDMVLAMCSQQGREGQTIG